MRVFIVIVLAFGVGTMAYAAFAVFKGYRMLSEHGLTRSSTIVSMLVTAGVFPFMVWMFIKTIRDTIREWPTAPHCEFTSKTVRAGVREAFTRQATEVRPAYRYGMLVIILALLAWNVQFLLSLPATYSGHRFGSIIVPLMLLFNHLAFSFRWPLNVSFAMHVLAYGWLVLGCCYIFFF